MYLLYRYARSAKPRSYMLETTIFILAISFFSMAPEAMGYIIPFPFSVLLLYICIPLSFPFYSWRYELFNYDVGEWQTYRSIRFLTTDITSTPSWKYGIHEFFFFFSFFLLVNVLGALLGYQISKKHRIQFGDEWKVLGGFAGVVCIVVSFILASALYERAAIALFWFGIFLLEMILLSLLIEPLEPTQEFLLWLTRARVATSMILGGIILLLVGQLTNHTLITIGGKMLILFGAIIYFVKLTVAYMRTREREEEAEKHA